MDCSLLMFMRVSTPSRVLSSRSLFRSTNGCKWGSMLLWSLDFKVLAWSLEERAHFSLDLCVDLYRFLLAFQYLVFGSDSACYLSRAFHFHNFKILATIICGIGIGISGGRNFFWLQWVIMEPPWCDFKKIIKQLDKISQDNCFMLHQLLVIFF
jgi:hypothetical protein